MSHYNDQNTNWLSELISSLLPAERDRTKSLMDCLVSNKRFTPQKKSLHMVLKRLQALYQKAIKIEWQSFDNVRIQEDERLIARLIVLMESLLPEKKVTHTQTPIRG